MPYQSKTTGEIISDAEYQAKFGTSQIPQTQPIQGFSPLRRFGGFLGDISGVSGIAKGFKGTLEGRPLKETIPQVAGGAAKVGLNLATLGGAGGIGSLGAKVAQLGTVGAGFSAAEAIEQGRKPSVGQLAIGATVGSAIPVLGKGTKVTKDVLTQYLPKSLIRAYLPGPTTKEISEYALKNIKLDRTNIMLSNTTNNIKMLSQQINDILSSLPEISISKKGLLNSVARSYGQTGGGGTITGSEVQKIITRVAPDIKGLLSKETLNLKDANRLRKAIDQALGDKFFLAKHTAFAKEVAGNFNSFLRDTVKSNAPKTIPLFDELSKEITVRNSLKISVKKFGKVNLRDLLAGVVGVVVGISTGGVGTALGTGVGIVGGQRFLSSPAVGLGVAKGLSKAGKVYIPETVKRIFRTGLVSSAGK